MQVVVTDHAADRFCERVAPLLTAAEAKALIRTRMPQARRLKRRGEAPERTIRDRAWQPGRGS